MGSKLAFILGLLMVFIITVLILSKALPGPHKSTDYLVMGTLGTFVCLIAVFLFSMTASGRPASMFSRRPKER